jgi:hypothetical protein
MKNAKWVVAVALVALSALAAAQRLGATRIVAQVPFEFMVANKTVPAGEYEVQAFTMDGNTLTIRNSEAKIGLFSPSSESEAKQRSANYALVFNQYGDRYFLSGIKLEGSKVTYHLPQSKAEVELRAQNVSATEDILLASGK